MSSEYVAKYAVDKMLKNKFIIIPGLTIKLTKFFAKIIPSNIIEEFCYHIQVAKNK
jgi:short-subunit dehydrogenase